MNIKCLILFLAFLLFLVQAVKKEEFHIAVVQAASDDKIEELKRLIEEEGSSPNAESKGIRPLHLAIRNQNIDMVRYLLSVGADPNLQNPMGENSAQLAIISDNDEIIQVVVSAESLDIFSKTPFNYNILHVAAIRGSLTTFQILKNRGYNAWNEQTEYLDTPLHTALKYGRQDIVWFLFNITEVQLDIENDAKWTPFLLSVVGGYLDIIKYLKEKGANDHQRNSDNETALHRAIQHQHNDVAQYLVEDLGHEVEPLDNYGWTPLHFSVLLGNIDGFDYLIEKGADPTRVTWDEIDLRIINEKSKKTSEETKQIFRDKFATLLPPAPVENVTVEDVPTEDSEQTNDRTEL